MFLDANVFVYAYDPSAGAKHELAKSLVRRVWESQTGCVSVQVLQELYVTLTRKVTRPLPIDEAEDRVGELAPWNVFAPTAGDVLAAIALQKQAKLSFWDAMIVHAAAASGCGECWTGDMNDGQGLRGVRIRNPFASA